MALVSKRSVVVNWEPCMSGGRMKRESATYESLSKDDLMQCFLFPI